MDIPHRSTIVVRDRSTLVSVLSKSDCYTIATGTHSSGMDYGSVSIPLRTDEVMRIGYITHSKRSIGVHTARYIENLKRHVQMQYDHSSPSEKTEPVCPKAARRQPVR